MTLVTPQTGPEGRLVRRVLVEEALDITRELYLGVTVDREKNCAVVIASEAGGMAIEEEPPARPKKSSRSGSTRCSVCAPFKPGA
jgi:succinyl-CoA synthetase beta subunit